MNENLSESVFSAHFPFWDKLSHDEKQYMLANTVTAHYKRGANIHSPGHSCIGILLIRTGHLRVYMMSEDGRDITLYRLFSGDTCILSASCVLPAITFDVYIDAEDDTEAYLVYSSAFREMAGRNVNVQCFGYKLTTERFSDVMWAMQQILFMSFDRRLAIFLLDELSKTGGDTLRLTHEQIAKYMGSAREVVTRMLKYFSGEGIVELFRGGVTVKDKTALKLLAGQSDFNPRAQKGL